MYFVAVVKVLKKKKNYLKKKKEKKIRDQIRSYLMFSINAFK